MKIRLMGTRGEINEVVSVLANVLDVREVSDFYPNRGASTLGRVYLEVGGVRPGMRQATAVRLDKPVIEPRNPRGLTP